MTAEKEKRTARELFEWVRSMIWPVLALVLLFSFVIRPIAVDGGSMRETLQDRDLLLVLNDALCGEYEAGDIVILSKESFHGGEPIVKRVIAVENQTVDIDFGAGVVYVDGEALEEPYTREPTYTSEGVIFPLTVPEGHIFVLGDNRNRSSDSRHPDIGTVDTRMVIGRAVILALPGKTADTERRDWSRVGPI